MTEIEELRRRIDQLEALVRAIACQQLICSDEFGRFKPAPYPPVATTIVWPSTGSR